MMQDITPCCTARQDREPAPQGLGLDDVQVHGIPDAAEAQPKRLNVVDLWEEELPIELGKPSGPLAARPSRAWRPPPPTRPAARWTCW